MDITAIRIALAAAAASADVRLRPYGWLPDSVDPPAVVVGMPSYEPASMQRGHWAMSFEVLLLVGTTWDRSAQKLVDELVPAIWTAIETDRTLDATAAHSEVMRWRAEERIDVAEFSMVGGVFDVEVIST